MHPSAILTLCLTGLAAASPYPRQASNLTNFLLVTTSQCPSTANSSALADVSALSLFDPHYQANYIIRTIGPGYGSLPRFNLTSGDLGSLASGPHGVGTFVYNSTGEVEGGQLMFSKEADDEDGNLALKNGYLLTVDGEEEGWTICEGPLDEEVIYWKGNSTSCTPTYIHAVADAPY
ncbi:hypothetical protein LTR56_002720 [Elasticomyces elasticus]|nr:hypothetical protein LTR56_002720 [Elasticomyces elasticus]KAK3666823.1 hypothetical protein LTR22_002410 [Elasticomyces elasticus]KAK4918847.1 hypothetical protein LTR49_013478 [Elasticomyces elasticus]KAK5758764.1 hypothetical protein LTS12_011158 [Elasticomyces elasticus]